MILKNVDDIYPATPMQELMLLRVYSSPNSDVLCENFSCRVHGSLNVQAFKRAWEEVVKRHAVLRTYFVWDNLEKPLNIVKKNVSLPWKEFNLVGMDKEEQLNMINKIKQSNRYFNVENAPLMSIELYKIGEDDYFFSWKYHHLILDGWCNWLILNEVFILYDTFTHGGGKADRLTTPLLFRNYVAWLQNQDNSKVESYWKEYLNNFSKPTPLPSDLVGKRNTNQFKEHSLTLSKEETSLLTRYIRNNAITLNSLIQFSWGMLLSSTFKQNDIVFGSTVSGRPADIEDIENMVGLFINNVPTRIQFDSSETIQTILKSIHTRQLEMRDYESAALTKIHEWSNLDDSERLFDSIIVFENYPSQSWAEGGIKGIQITDIQDNLKTSYSLTLVIVPEECLKIRLVYSEHKFSSYQVKEILRILKTIILKTASSSGSVSLIQEVAELEIRQLNQIVMDRTYTNASSQNKVFSNKGYLDRKLSKEEVISDIWKYLLQTQDVNVNDNFFEIGGNSLLLIQLHKIIQETFNIEFSIIDLFHYPTISSLLAFIQNLESPSTIENVTENRTYRGSERGKKQRALLKKRREVLGREERK